MATGGGSGEGASGETDGPQGPPVPIPSDDEASQVPPNKLSASAGIPRLKRAVMKSYPGLLGKSYFVPSVHMNRTKYTTEDSCTDEDRTALKPKPPMASDIQTDHAQQHVLHCFHFLSQPPQVMFVLSQIDFSTYLKLGKSWADLQSIPKIWDPQLKGHQRGDFDILVIHRHLGVLAIEIKSVGYLSDDGSWSDEQMRELVYRRMDKKALQQLDKVKKVLCHLLSDLDPLCRVTLSLALPYVPRSQLRAMLDSHPDLKKDLCQYLAIPDTADPSQYCLLADDMPEKTRPWEMTDSVKEALGQWWAHVMSDRGEDETMTDDRYVDIVSRFCGPATEVTLRTLGEGVSHVGDQFTRLVLTPEQVDILKADDPRLCLCGPPGVGKTVLLIQKALDWLREGREVHIISIKKTTMAAAELIYGELCASELSGPGHTNVQLHHVAVEGRKEVINDLKAAAKRRKVAVVMDETGDVMNKEALRHVYKSFQKRQKILQFVMEPTRIDRLWLVAESDISEALNSNSHPLAVKTLRNPLRTPPAVTREIQRSALLAVDYCAGEAPVASDGPRVVHWCHRAGTEGHAASSQDCLQCGKDVARILIETLHVGQSSSGNTSKGQQQKKTNLTPAPLRFKDVFILTEDTSILPRKVPKKSLRAPGFLDGLSQGGLPVRTVARGDQRSLKELVSPDRPEEVVVANLCTVRGLERKVVVWKQWREGSFLNDKDLGRLHGASRSTSQLLILWADEQEMVAAERGQ